METTPPEGTGAIIAAAKRFGEAEVLELHDDIAVISLPDGRKVQSIKPFLDEYLDKPERRSGTATLTTLTSFIEHVNRHKDANSVVFAHVSPTEAQLLAVFDYNPSGADGGARFGRHRALYGCPFSDEWNAWTGKRGEMGMADFAQFLEDRIMDVLSPAAAGETIAAFAEQLNVQLASPQKLMELSRGLTINVGQKVVNNVNLSSGEARIAFEEKHAGEAGEAVKVPGAFAIAIPVFRNGDLFQVPVRLRYRTSGGQITWSFALQRTERIRDIAVGEACKQAAEKTALPLFYGKPEA